MHLRRGARLGPYEVLESLGQGGMGEVYRAHDSRLRRDVALKIIHPDLAHADHIARFRREARILAALCHPCVANVYEFEEVDGTAFLVMELVPGDTLADRLAAGPLPVPEALRIAGQVAAALEAVHDKGIVHRDLKPANIKVTAEGLVKVLDFGLAKTSVEKAAAQSHLPTATVDATREGLIVGTAAYMSPEQARGWEVDRRTDVWSFGCVLYEMLSGRSPFAAGTVADTIAAVMERELDWNALPPSTPPMIARLVRRCLQRDPKRRLRDIGDARLDIEDTATDVVSPDSLKPVAARARRRTLTIAAIGLLAAGILLGALATRGRRPTAPGIAGPARFMISLPSATQLGNLDFPSVAIAPDGSHLAYVATRGGQTQLWVRPMSALESLPLAGTTNAIAPFFSPDGRWIAFFANGQLKKVAVSGGTPVTLCEAQVGLGGSWGPGDTIVFAAATGSGLSQVSASGGRPQRVTTLDLAKGEFSHRWPEWLPDGRTVLYTVGTVGSWNDAQIVAHSLATGERSVLVQGGTNPHYLPSGHLLYARNGRIMSAPFDRGSLTVTGTAVPVLENILQSSDGAAQLVVSQAGHAVYVGGGSESGQRRLVSVARDGAAAPFAGPLGPYASPRVSPDGRTLLVTIETPTPDLWVYDIRSGVSTQLTFEAGATSPLWTRDGQRVVFSSTRSGPPNLFMASAAQPGPVERLAPSENPQIPGSWSPDATLAYVERHSTTGRDILLLGLRDDRAPRPLVATPADESAPRYSPDGRWLAYVANDTGRNEVYLRQLGESGRSQQISRDGGAEPVWALDGRELFYREGDRMMAVPVGGGDIRAARPQALFEGDFARGTLDSPNYDVMPDGQRFVMVQRPAQASAQTTLHVLINWLSALGATSSR